MEGVRPRHRFMSAYEQRVEPPDRQWQYLLFAAEPYETIAFKVRTYLVSNNTNYFTLSALTVSSRLRLGAFFASN